MQVATYRLRHTLVLADSLYNTYRVLARRGPNWALSGLKVASEWPQTCICVAKTVKFDCTLLGGKRYFFSTFFSKKSQLFQYKTSRRTDGVTHFSKYKSHRHSILCTYALQHYSITVRNTACKRSKKDSILYIY